MAPLHGYVVVDLSSGIAGAYCTKLLADGGAEVIKVEPPEGDPLRSWSASGARIEPGADGALFSFLACSKRSVVADPDIDSDVTFAHELLGSAGAVVWSSQAWNIRTSQRWCSRSRFRAWCSAHIAATGSGRK